MRTYPNNSPQAAARIVALAMTDRQGIEIDYCPQCRGVWLDRGELDKLLERAATVHHPEPPAQRRSAILRIRTITAQEASTPDARSRG